MAVPGRPTPNKWKEAALEPGPPANYGTVAQEYPPTAVQTTECLTTILWLVLAMCMAAKAPCMLENFFKGVKEIYLARNK